MTTRFMQILDQRFVCIVAVLAVLVFFLFHLEDPSFPPVRADGAGYYAYLPAILLDHDPGFEHLARRYDPYLPPFLLNLDPLARSHYGGEIPGWMGISRFPATGRYLDKFNMGVSVLMLPFFLVAHFLTWLFQSPPGAFPWWRFNYPMDGYSFFYQQAAGLSGVFYMVCGVALLKRWLERYYTPGVVLAALATILGGTNLFWYGSGEPVLSHPYTFFLFCVLGAAIPWWQSRSESVCRSAALGILLGLLVLVRTTGVFAVLLLLFDQATTISRAKERVRFLAQRWKSLGIMFLCALAVFFPQLWMWKGATGSWIINSYSAEPSWNWLSPALIATLISIKKGLLFYSPVLGLSLIGIVWMCVCRRPLGMASMTLFCAMWYVSGGWHSWWSGGSFGNRFFIDTMPFLAFGLSEFFYRMRSGPARVAAAFVVVACVSWTLFLLKLYCTREMSYEGLDSPALFDIFWSRKEWLLSVLGRAGT